MFNKAFDKTIRLFGLGLNAHPKGIAFQRKIPRDPRVRDL